MHRTIKKITPRRLETFDQQFWPVLVALTVLCGIAIGAAVTLLRGPWMWGSLLFLPTASAFAIFVLSRIDDSRLRRALQLAIIVSLAAHLLILVISSIVIVFQNPFQQPERPIAQRQQRTIEISNQRTQFVWEETNDRETPEPKIETERQKQTTTNVKPQPVPVTELQLNTPVPKPQLVRRETPAQTVPRQDRSLSQLRRQTQNQQPKSSETATEQTAAASSVVKQAATPPEPTESAASHTVQRQSTTHDFATSASPPVVAPTETQSRTVAVADSSPRRAEIAERTVKTTPRSSESTARRNSSTPEIPLVQKRNSVLTSQPTTSKPVSDPQPSAVATQITRRQTPSKTSRPAPANAPKTETSPQPQIARAAERRATNNVAPSISSLNSQLAQPRRSTNDARIAASPIQIEKPAHQPDSQSQSSELSSKTLSVSRSTAGIAGAGRSANLESATGGMTSPATRPSDSAIRRRTENVPTEVRQLASSQRSSSRRSSGSAPMPTSAFRVDTTSMAKISGSVTPSDHSVESSAARIDSATAEHRGEVSAEKGTTSVDLGPTKIVNDTTESTRRSGGGQPEVSQLNPDLTRRSRSADNQQPTLVADSGAEAVAPRSQSSAPSSTELEPNAESTAVARIGGENPVTLERDAAIIKGEFSNRGDTDLASALADSPTRTETETNDPSDFSDDDDDDEDEKKMGNRRTRVALAPVIRGDPGLGGAELETGQSITQAESPSDDPAESLAGKLTRTATAALPGSGIGRSATALLMRAATSLPVVESSGPRRAEGSASVDARKSLETGAALSKPSELTESNQRSSLMVPKLTDPVAGLPTNQSATVTKSNDTWEATDVAMERLESSFADQGASMEVVAIEGPAGLADRPDIALGVMTRPASRDSLQIQPDLDHRFRNTHFGGTLAINPDAVLAREAFRQRTPAALANAMEPTTEAAIQLGLEFLAKHQTTDGSWSLAGFDANHPQHASQLNSDTAATALAVLAFQGAGYNHREFKHARTVNHGVQWLIENQSADGGLYVEADKKSNAACRMYSHGIAALALTEAYGMTQDIQLKAAAQKAIDYIIASQDPRKGGWRYFDDPKMKSSDTSVTGWMMMALQSGRLAGLEVDPNVFKGIDQWIDSAADPNDSSKYVYNPYALDSDGISRLQGRQPTASMTAVGLLMRIYSGWDRNDPQLLDGATFLVMQHLPSDVTSQKRDTYYWYYATQVLKHIDGPLWEKWDAKLRPLLIRSQVKTGDMAGSWHPYHPIPDRWGSFGGRLYVTTMNLLSLEVRHRMLPLYQKTNVEED